MNTVIKVLNVAIVILLIARIIQVGIDYLYGKCQNINTGLTEQK